MLTIHHSLRRIAIRFGMFATTVTIHLYLGRNANVNVNIHVYSPDISVGSADCYLQPWFWNTLFYGLISSGENSAFTDCGAAIANHSNLAFSFYQVPTNVL